MKKERIKGHFSFEDLQDVSSYHALAAAGPDQSCKHGPTTDGEAQRTTTDGEGGREGGREGETSWTHKST